MTNEINYSLNAIINTLPFLRPYARKLSELEMINNVVQQVLDAKTKKHCVVANVKKDTLILSTTSPTWKHQIRFLQFEILAQLQRISRFSFITKIKTIVDSLDCNELIKHDSNKLLEKPSISSHSAQIITDMASDIKSKKLSDSLKRLAEKAKKQ